MSKSQKEGNISKSKLIGKDVVDQEGNLVGTVKDVGFAVGKQGVSLVVEKDGESQDISWDAIQGAADFVILKPAQQAASVAPQALQQQQPQVQTYTQPVQVQPQTAQPVQQAQPAAPLCPICHNPLTWIPQYKRWYCYKDQKYA